MTLRTALLPALSTIRGILGPSGLDLRPTSVTIQTRASSGQFTGQGVSTVTSSLTLPPGVKVRHVTEREVQSSGGRMERGDVMVSLITPAFTAPDGTTGGFTEAQLDPAGLQSGTPQPGIATQYVLAQQSGATGIAGVYTLVDFQRDRALHYNLVLRRTNATPWTVATP